MKRNNKQKLQWQQNHNAILNASDKLVRLLDRLPFNSEIAAETNLTERTVYSHLKAIQQPTQPPPYMHKFQLLEEKFIAQLAQLALDGDLRATRLALQVLGTLKLPKPNSII